MILLTIEIETEAGKEVFEVKDFPHDDTHRCKLEVFQSGEFIASFQPDRHGELDICKKSGKVNDDVLHTIAEKLEFYNL